MSPIRPPTAQDVLAARDRIGARVRRTPTFVYPEWRGLAAKLENLQHLGSFKTRGAMNRVTLATADERAGGFATASAGNHGLSLSHAAASAGVSCLVHVPERAVARKVDAIRALGAEVERAPMASLRAMLIEGDGFDHGARTFIHPWVDAGIAAGHDTLALELCEDAPDAGTLVIPLGGGGLASGVLAGVEAARASARVRVIGVQAGGAAAWLTSLNAGHASSLASADTIADGIAVPWAHPALFERLRKGFDAIVTVSDAEVRAAMREAARVARVIVEPAGAAALAACLREGWGKGFACVLTGGNAAPALVADVLTEGA